MSNKLIFKDAEVARDAIMASQKKEIAALYESWADEIGERAKYYSLKSNASAPVSERYYRELQKQLRATSQEISNEIYNKIKNNMYTVSDAVIADNVNWLKSFGFSDDGLNAAFSYVPDSVVRNLITGQIYESGWSLSKAIWSDNEKALKDIYQVMAKGLAENKPIYEIAKELEAYVSPSRKLPWNLTAPDGVRIYKKQVDYNAQRLARTLVQHSYQQSFIAATKNNPFITEYVWISNGSRVCELCMSRDGQHYKKDELPMDHPNGMCVMEPVVADDMVDKLADWFNSPDGTYPEIDEFAGNFGYEVKAGTGVQSVIKQVRSYTDKQIKSASKFLKKFEFDNNTTDYYMNALKGTEQEFQNVFVDALKKKVKNWDYSDSSSYYSSYKNEIRLNDRAINAWLLNMQGKNIHMKQTLFHEIGHAIDDLAHGTNAKFSKTTKFKFKEMMLKDMKEINSRIKNGDKEFIKAINDMIMDDSSKGVQDAISAMHCKGIGLTDAKEQVRVRWSHTQEYYERSDAKNEAASELFANMCGAKVDPKAQEYMEQYFPNAMKEFEKIIKEIGK